MSASRSNPSTPSEDSDPALPEEPVITSSAAVALKDTADHPQDWPRAPLFTSRPIAKHVPVSPKGEAQSLTHEEVYYAPKEVLLF